MPDKLNIFNLTAWYPSVADPVNATFVREHIRAAARYNNCSVWAFYVDEDRPTGDIIRTDEIDDGIPTVRTWLPFGRTPKLRYLMRLSMLVKIGRKLIDDADRPDIIHAHTFHAGVPALIIGRKLGIPVIITEHWTGFERQALTLVEKWKARWSMRRVAAILPVSSYLAEQIKQYGIDNQFIVVPNSVDTTIFHPADDATSQRDQIKLLTVALQKPVKGIPLLLEAVEKLKANGHNLSLDIVGNGPNLTEYVQISKERAVDDIVSFRGYLPKPDIANMMRNADLLVHTSFVETFSVVIAEALCCGLPVVASDIPPLPDRIDTTNGLLFPVKDVTALVRSIEQMIERSDDYNQVEIATAAHAKYNSDAVGAQLDQIYRSLLKEW